MALERVHKKAAFEWLVGGIGVMAALLQFPSWLTWQHLGLAVLLLLVSTALEAMPLPLGRSAGSLMVSVPVAVLLLYGPGSAINLMVAAELLAPVLSRRKLRPAAWLFNAGQYALSLCAMAGVFDLVEPLPAAVGTGLGDGRTLAGLVLGLAVFLAVNQALLNLDQWLGGTFHPGEALRLLAHDSFCVLIALPLSVLTVVVSLISPYAGALVTVPLAIIGHTLRLYHRMSYMQRVHLLTAELASEFDVDRICQKTALTAAQLVFADAVCVYVLDHRNGQLVPTVVYPPEQAPQFGTASMHAEHGGMVWRVLHQAQWVYVPNVRRDPRVQRDSRVPAFQNAFQSLAVFPLHAYGRTQGALVCVAVQPYAFEEEQLGYVATLTAQAAVLLENARLYQTLQEQSVRDAATGLYNYRYFYRELERRVRLARENGQPLAVAVIDVDHFKKFNDTYGHLAGDEVLRAVGRVLVEEAGPDSVVARYGGEEFCIILPYGADQAFAQLERVRQAVARITVEYEGYHLRGITVSCGLAVFPEHAEDDRGLLLKADSTLYWGSKQRGRNRTAIYSPNLDVHLFVDELTGLYTYHFASIRVREEFQRGIRRWGVVCLDLNQFTFVNSAFGYEVGDRVLKEASLLIKQSLRQDELACRFGADEFAVFIPETGPVELQHIAERIAKAIANHRFECGPSIILSLRCRYLTHCFEAAQEVTDVLSRVNDLFAELDAVQRETLA